jgi:hypothetical protein
MRSQLMMTIPSWIDPDVGAFQCCGSAQDFQGHVNQQGRNTVSSTTDDATFGGARWDKLRRKLQELRPVLITQGSLVKLKKRGQWYWYLRYYDPDPGSRKQRSVYIGSEEIAQRVRQLLEQIRAPGEFLRETLLLADLVRHVVRPLLRRGDRSEPQE